MTGIERLRTLAGAWDAYGLGGALGDVARQIERERACDADTTENVRLIVGGVIDSMERHVSGVEGMEDSPVARWARELRAALGGEGRDPAEDVSMSAYDLLPQEDRDAIAWVRENGGLDAVKRRWECLSYYADPVPRSYAERRIASRQRQIDESHAALRRRNERIAELERERDELREMVRQLNDQTDEMEKRLMPEGMEWPRFEDGEPVRVGDKFAEHGGCENVVYSVEINDFLFKIHGFDGADSLYGNGSSVKRPAPKVLDADGVEIRVGDRVWSLQLDEPHEWTVLNPRYGSNCVLVSLGDRTGRARPENLTHRALVLAADGRPLREGEAVWAIDDGIRYEVRKAEVSEDGRILVRPDYSPYDEHIDPALLTHERPDSWERLEKDAKMDPGEYCETYGLRDAHMGREAEECAKASDLVRRAKKLAGDE